MWNPMDSRGLQAAHRAPPGHAAAHEDDPFDLPPLDGFPPSHEAALDDDDTDSAFAPFPTSFPFAMDEERPQETDPFAVEGSVHSDEFVDAEAFMADHKPGEDSFLREATESGDVQMGWSDDEGIASANDRRASAIFIPKSRNMEKVEFSSPKHTIQKSIPVEFETPLKSKVRGSVSNSVRTPVSFSASNTAMSFESDIHVDHRVVLTPNTSRALQQRQRLPTDDFSLSEMGSSFYNSKGVDHSGQAKQAIDANATALTKVPDVSASPFRPHSAERAMHAGPHVIKKALHEFESLLQKNTLESMRPPTHFENADSVADLDPALDELQSTVRKLPVGLVHQAEERDGLVHSYSNDRDPHRWTKASDVHSAGVQADCMSDSDMHEQARSNPQPTYDHPAKPAEQVDELRDVKSERNQDDCVPVYDARVQARSNRQPTQFHASKPALQMDESHAAGKSMAIEEMMATMSVAGAESHGARLHVNEAGKADQSEVVAHSNKFTQAPRQVRSVESQTRDQASRTDRDEIEKSSLHARAPPRPKEVQHETTFRRDSPRQSLEAAARTVDPQKRESLESYTSARFPSRRKETRIETAEAPKKKEHARASIKASLNSLPLAASVPTQMARRCRRFLCTVGEHMSEQIVFSNGSSRVGRICVSLLPLSTGCQQFSVTPAVLELQPRSRSAFTVTFDASRPGVVAGIFQFRAVGIDGLYEPYEVLIEASVRGDLQLSPGLPRPKPSRPQAQTIKSAAREPRVTELPAQALAGVQITPTFLRFAKVTSGNGLDVVVGGQSIRITNTTTESIEFQVKSSHEHLQLSKARGSLTAGSEVRIYVQPICCPFQFDDGERRDWCGSMTVVVGDMLSREVSVVIDRNALALLPTFDEAARVRQTISAQTDSFYYTKKVNRRGLYFHARAVECGSCVVGESHHVPVYICNGSDAPMTVFLQALQEPFSCMYQPTTLQARKFIEVPVTFTPKATGKVATCLVAYTVTGKAAVTLIARGVDKSASSAPAHA